MIRCLVVDDEPLARELLVSYIDQLPQLECAAVCSSALQAFAILHEQPIDLLFLDIQMPGISGLNFIKSVKHPPQVIFTTAFMEHAVEAFELEAVDYLLKPITLQRFIKAVQKVNSKNQEQAAQPLKMEEPDFIFLKVDKRLIKINHDELLYAESLGDYLKVITATQTHVTYLSMNKLEALLPSPAFARIHRSYLVNLRQVQFIEGNFVRINDQDLPIGLTYKPLLSEKFRAHE